jgi:hypothetical protein
MADTLVEADVSLTPYFELVRAGPVWTDASTAYVVYIDNAADLVYRKTANGGATWGDAVTIRTGTVSKSSIWFDKWTSGDSGTILHIAYIDTIENDVFYRDLDTSDDSLGTEVTAFAGASIGGGSWTGGVADITKSRGGNLYIGFWGDADGEFGFYRSTNSGADWTSRGQLADGDVVDGILLLPGNEADNQDIWCIYWDRSADEISLKVYDDSGNSWGETSISGSMVDGAFQYQMSAAPRHSDGHIILVAWSEIDSATADLKVWDINGSGSITAKTNVVTDLAESVQVAVLINQQNDDIYVAYLKGGTFLSALDTVYKKSADGGGSWGSEEAYSETTGDLRVVWAGISVDDAGGKFQPMWEEENDDELFVNLVNDVDIAAANGAPNTRRYSLTVTGVG